MEDISKKGEKAHFNKEKIDALIFPGDRPFEKKLSFSDYLEVVYTRESEMRGYRQYVLQNRVIHVDNKQVPQQTSWIKLSLSSATFTTAGHVPNPYAVTKYGYWAWERFAEELPLDYTPENL